MSVVVKTAVVAALIRVFATIFPELTPMLTQAFAVLIAVTLMVANFGALMQRGVKRLLAYSAVAHAGYLGLAVLAASDAGMRAAIWYLLAYTLMNVGAFAVLTLLTDKNDHGDAIERFNGLGRTRPWLAVALTIFLLSLAGIPPLAGFAAKIFVFTAAITAGHLALAVLAIVTSVVAAFYYFEVVRAMYFREAEYDPPQSFSRATQAVVAVAAIGTVLLGLLPGWWYELITIGQGLLSVAGF
jgi:NADH-quinone oxidoreductase subunit N